MPFAIYALFWRDGERKRFILIFLHAMCTNSNVDGNFSALKQRKTLILHVNFKNVSLGEVFFLSLQQEKKTIRVELTDGSISEN